LLKEHTQVIRNAKANILKIKNKNKSLIAKYDIAMKAIDELKDKNKVISYNDKVLKCSLRDI
jgi:hypothetical protein